MATSSPLESSPIRLTELTDCGGCAAKLGADVLAEALAGLGAGSGARTRRSSPGWSRPTTPPRTGSRDDLAIIGTLDFFPPLVDDPATYGEIAAANALSDVFAMGGRVLFALSIAAFPEDFPRDGALDGLRGGGRQGARSGRDARRRPHDPRPRAEVRPGGHRRGASRSAVPQGRRTARRRPDPDQAAGDGPAGERPAPGPRG